MKRFHSRPVKFAVVGLANTAAGLAAIFAAKYFFGLDDVTANFLGYGLGLMLGFLLNASWTFLYRGSYLLAFGLYLLTFATSYAVNLGIVLLLIHGFGTNSYLAQAAGVPFYTVCFFAMCQLVVFRQCQERHGTSTP